MMISYSNTVFDVETFLEMNRARTIIEYEFAAHAQSLAPAEFYLAMEVKKKIDTDAGWSAAHFLIHKTVDDFKSQSYWSRQKTH